jgi:hypothetical protein
MNFLKKDPVDLDKLREEIGEAPRVPKEKFYAPLQVIGHAITRLTWSDAVKMGEAIQAKLKEGELTAAIQEWAKDWESFND